MADENNNNQLASTSGHESEGVNVGGLKASLQKLKTDIIDEKYTKPGSGIPSTDMSSAVQTSLGKADTSVQHSTDTGVGIVPEDGIRAETVAAAATLSVNPDVVTVISGSVGTSAITLQVPSDNLAHVWDILMTTGSAVNVTLVMSNSATIKVPTYFALAASKAVELSIVGVGSTYYLRYGEFA